MKKVFMVVIVLMLLFAFGCGDDGVLGFCTYPDCGNLALDGSSFCIEHQGKTVPKEQTCLEPGCYNTPLRGNYCSEHVCLQGGCTNRRSSEFYCSQHGG